MTSSLTRRSALGAGLATLAAPMLMQRADAMPSSPLRIGVIGNETAGITQRAAMLNGGHGHEPSVELLVREGIADEAAARDAVASLLEAGVHGLISTSLSWIGLSVMDAAEASCTPMVSTAPMAEVSRPYVFQAGPSQAQVDRALMSAVTKAGHATAGVLSLERLSTPEDAAAAHGVVLTGVDGAFWSVDQGRFFTSKGAVAVMLQFTHITTGADAKAANTTIAQAAMDRVD